MTQSSAFSHSHGYGGQGQDMQSQGLSRSLQSVDIGKAQQYTSSASSQDASHQSHHYEKFQQSGGSSTVGTTHTTMQSSHNYNQDLTGNWSSNVKGSGDLRDSQSSALKETRLGGGTQYSYQEQSHQFADHSSSVHGVVAAAFSKEIDSLFDEWILTLQKTRSEFILISIF